MGQAYLTLHRSSYHSGVFPEDRLDSDRRLLHLLAPWNEEVKAEIERRANDLNQ